MLRWSQRLFATKQWSTSLPRKAEELLESQWRRHNSLIASLDNPGEDIDHAKLGKELASLAQSASNYADLQKQRENHDSLVALMDDAADDPEMKAMAEEEMQELNVAIEALEETIKGSLTPVDAADTRNVILEVRSGAGGDEASLFAAELFEMYAKAARQNQWTFEKMEVATTDAGGLRNASASISGTNVFKSLKFEVGVHRVQRIPATESQGRLHTSTVTVAVLPEADEVEVDIDPKDLRIDTYRSQGAGGQSVNTTDSAVRITHTPTNTVVTCQDERSQHKNRAKAMKILLARLFEVERQRAADERASARSSQVGSGERSERIRTYNFPQQRVTDHRIGFSIHDMDGMLNGQLLHTFHEKLTVLEATQYLASLEDVD